ncbi:MAG: helix-turn-helix domain-containing protein [Candidatus Nanoarchaeia archaeon]|nr:helix-turn-helix domain-containing protein [Candidatus Nanoarchaeia archaeon]MDD5588078.1 helix-turn-helix domain-containing protein [Candidatus Nanoarchaeia archaeon]
MIETTLKKIGLTEGEIKVYLSLLELGASSTGKIIKKSGISGSKVYEVLDRLANKGLVSLTTKNGVKYFEASSPTKILEYLEEQKEDIDKEKQEIQKIIPELILKQKNAPKSEVKVYTGWEGMKTVNEDIISSLKKGEEWLSMGLTEQPESWEVYFTQKQKERAKKGIKHKHLLNEKYKSLYKKRKLIPNTEFRFLSKDFEMPISTEIYKNKLAIFILLKEAPTTIVIESKVVAESFRKYFYLFWKTAKN